MITIHIKNEPHRFDSLEDAREWLLTEAQINNNDFQQWVDQDYAACPGAFTLDEGEVIIPRELTTDLLHDMAAWAFDVPAGHIYITESE